MPAWIIRRHDRIADAIESAVRQLRRINTTLTVISRKIEPTVKKSTVIVTVQVGPARTKT